MGSEETLQVGRALHQEVHTRTFLTFCHLNLKVDALSQGSQELIARFKETVRVLQDSDDGALITMYQQDSATDHLGMYCSKDEVSLKSPQSVPPSLTRLNRFFQGSRPRAAGGQVYTHIRLLHQIPYADRIANCLDELQELVHRLTAQSIHHFDSKRVGVLHLFHPEVDDAHWTEFFTNKVSALAQRSIPIGQGPSGYCSA